MAPPPLRRPCRLLVPLAEPALFSVSSARRVRHGDVTAKLNGKAARAGDQKSLERLHSRLDGMDARFDATERLLQQVATSWTLRRISAAPRVSHACASAPQRRRIHMYSPSHSLAYPLHNLSPTPYTWLAAPHLISLAQR